jgi:3-oxoadipate enol-lactonase
MQFPKPLFVTVAGRKLAYTEVSPPAPQGTILLLTGLAAKRQGWYHQLEAFGRHYRTIALDHRDAGDSDLTPGPYRISDQAADAVAVVRALGVERLHLVGISMGGFISLELILRHPTLVDRLVLVATSAGGPGAAQPRRRLMLKYLASALLLARAEPGERSRRVYSMIMGRGYARRHPEEMDRIATIARYQPMSRAAFNRQLGAIRQHDVSQRLGEIRAPTLVIHGEDDPLVPVENGRHLARAIPGARLLIYPNTGHIPIIERAEMFNRDVLAFLGERHSQPLRHKPQAKVSQA